MLFVFFFNDTATTEIYTLSLHDALPILAPQPIDLEFMEWLGENGIPFSIIFTKVDKLKGGRLKMNINAYLQEMKKQWEELPPHFISSSENRTGRTEILNYIENINKELNAK